MKKLLSLATLIATVAFFTLCFAAPTHVSRYIMDASCTAHKAMEHPSAKTTACAISCVKRGSPAVLVERNGKVLKIANQDAVMSAVGHRARLTGTVANGEITVSSVQVFKGHRRPSM